MFMDEADLLDLDKELNEAGLDYDGKEAKKSKDEAKPVTGAGGYGRHAAPSGKSRSQHTMIA